MAGALAKDGLYIDELSKVRVLEPEVAHETSELKEQCRDFVEKITEFQKIADGFILMADSLAKDVEKEKMRAIGTRNLLKSVAKQREAEQQKLQALITEKSMELERLRIQYQSLQKTQLEQQEIIDFLVLHR
jgi:intraflagellar transport protein 20